MLKPMPGFSSYVFERSRFFEQMTGTRDDRELFRAGELRERLLIHVDDGAVIPADKQQRRCDDSAEVRTRQVRSPAT